MADVDCPYFNRDSKKCALFDTYQDGYQRESVCMSSSNWKSCSKELSQNNIYIITLN